MALTIQWTLFLPGIVLLLIPADVMLSSVVQIRTFESFHSLHNSRRYRPWWWVPALWLDPLRAFAGAWLIKASLTFGSTSWAGVPKGDFSVLIGLMVCGLVCQLYTRREPDVMLAPLGYVVGLCAAVLPGLVLLVVTIGAVTALFAFRNFAMFFTGGAVAVAFGGVVLGAEPIWFLPALILFVLPLVACLVTGRSLELPTRDASDATGRFV